MGRRWGVVLAGLMLTAASDPRMEKAILPSPAVPSAAVQPFVKVQAAQVVLTHVRVIDGTGAPAQEDRTILIAGGRIAAIGGPEIAIPAGASVIDLTGKSVMPGIVGMHDHMYYAERPNLTSDGTSEPPIMVPEMAFSSPKMYLANGVTTMRTTGAVEPATDINIKRAIDRGELVGPHMDVTGPYLEGAASPFIQMQRLNGPDNARAVVAFWADQGVTSFKAYMNITRVELKAAITEAHRRGLKITGHLCSVTYPEAAALGIDDLEHGFFVNTQLDPGKKPDMCPDSGGDPTLTAMTPGSAAGAALIKLLVDKHVAVTSTLPVFEDASAAHKVLPQRQLDLLTVEARTAYLYGFARVGRRSAGAKAELATLWTNELAMERAFVAAGGMLLAGPDPTGDGHVLPGFGDQRAIELLVEAGFTPLEAIRIGTLNGATYLGLADRIGSIATGKNADLMVLAGDPSRTIADIEKVTIVFKDGIGYDPEKLLGAVRGRYGQY